ncbi:MAG: VCBS repeat-containing protein, partial [Candidatus Omnitrophica bacterium]|nr:VCBS repeat-containing protein [Candidatus Omnitrophota bacterium]
MLKSLKRTLVLGFAFLIVLPQIVSASTSVTTSTEKSIIKAETKPAPAVKAASTATKPKAALTSSSGSGLDTGIQNVAKTIMVDQRSGGAGVSVPLYIPEGRGGVTPPLQLTWSPTAGDGPFGFGWLMEMGSVVRNTKNGAPHYNEVDPDTFIATIGGKSYELVSLGANSANNEYRSKFDDDRMRFFFVNGVWSAKDRTGTTYYFGSRTGSTVNDGGSKVFKWKLDRIEDLFGNVLVADYALDGSFEVRYGLKAGLSTITDVNDKANFAYVINAAVQPADRADKSTNYKAGFAISESRLMSTLVITGGGNLLKKYSFNYAASARTNRSLLKSVTETGADGTTTQTMINLQYNDAIVPAYTIQSSTDSSLANLVQLSGDFNGDGKTDLATYSPSTGTFQVALSNGSGFSPRTTWIDNFGVQGRLFFGDFNGDGKTDIASFNPDTHEIDVALSNGTKFLAGGVWPYRYSVYYGVNAKMCPGDFNGDGRTDIFGIRHPDAIDNVVQFHISDGVSEFTYIGGRHPQFGPETETYMTTDFNGDG